MMDEPKNNRERPVGAAEDRVTTSSRIGAATPAVQRPRRRWIAWLIILLVVALVMFAIFRPHAGKQAGHGGPGGHRHAGAGAGAQPVSVAKAESGDMPIIVTQLGTVTALATITVQSQISGYLLSVNFKEGQEVHKGDLLAQVDPRPYQATLQQYEGQLQRDQGSLKEARADLARYQLLLKQKSIAEQTANNQFFVVAQDEGTVRNDEGLIAYEKQQIDYCSIRSPIDGRVGLRQIDAGNYITSSETNGLVVVTQLKPISVIFSLPEDQIEDVAAGLRAGETLSVDAYDRTDTTKLASGKVETIDNTIDVSTGTVRVRATFPNDDERLFPNQFVNARLLVKTQHNAILVPNSAIQTGPQGYFVYVVKADDTVAVQQVKTGASDGTRTVIASGLTAGQTVVTDGTDKLKTGSKITVPAANGGTADAGQKDNGQRHHRKSGGDGQ